MYDKPNIEQPILSIIIEEDLGNTATAHLPYLETDDLLLLTDDEYPSEEETEKEDEFDLRWSSSSSSVVVQNNNAQWHYCLWNFRVPFKHCVLAVTNLSYDCTQQQQFYL